jgi:hypothetical protein
MKRFTLALFSVAVVSLAAATLAFFSQGARPALACSGPPTHWQMADAPRVVAGRIVSADEDETRADTTFRWFRLQIDVTDAFRGTSPGQRIEASARVPRGGVPVMCPQFDRDETFIGKFVVAGLYGEAELPELGRWPTAYIGHDPASLEYADAVRVARIATGGGPDLPALTVEVPAGRCGSLVTIRGSRFEPGRPLLLNYPQDPPPPGGFVRPTVVPDASGQFVYTFRLPQDWCPVAWYHVEAYADAFEGQLGGWPLAMAPLRASQPAAPLPPDAGNSAQAEFGDGYQPPARPIFAIGSALVLTLSLALRLRARR